MGSKKGGGGGGGYAPPAPRSNYTPPPDPFALDIDRWRGVMGPTPTPNTFTAQGKPPWMTGWFDMPTWGAMAADPSRMLTQQDLMVGRTDLPPPSEPEPEPEPAPVAPPQGDPVTAAKRYMAWRRANSLNSLSNKGGIPYGNDNDMSYERYLSQLDYWN